MTLPLLPTTGLDDPNQRRRVRETVNNILRDFGAALFESGDWTPVVRGSGTAGTYEIATQRCRYTRFGNRVILDVFITLASAVTGGGTGTIVITGAPFEKKAFTLPIGTVQVSGVDFTTAGASLSMTHTATDAATADLQLVESADNITAIAMAIAGFGANDTIRGSVCFEIA